MDRETVEMLCADFRRGVNRCKACDTKFDGIRKHMHIDHCHSSGIVRGILCQACNLSLGTMKEDAVRIFKLAKYAEQFCADKRTANV